VESHPGVRPAILCRLRRPHHGPAYRGQSPPATLLADATKPWSRHRHSRTARCRCRQLPRYGSRISTSSPSTSTQSATYADSSTPACVTFSPRPDRHPLADAVGIDRGRRDRQCDQSDSRRTLTSAPAVARPGSILIMAHQIDQFCVPQWRTPDALKAEHNEASLCQEASSASVSSGGSPWRKG